MADPSADFAAQQQAVHAALVAVSRTAAAVAAEDLTFLRTVNPQVAGQLDDHAARLLRLANGLLQSAAGATGRRAPPELEDADDVEVHWKGVVDVIDGLLEKADTTLDEYTGLLKRKDAPTAEGGPESKKAKQQTGTQQGPSEKLDWSIRRANIAKPQELFERKPDNWAPGPWKPLLTTKPHAVVSLEQSLTTFVDDYGQTQYRHPYETEIKQMQYPAAIYQKREPILFQPVETTQAVWVDTFEGVQAMLEELRTADEIAVDLEHHDYRTYTGLLSLMQISTRTKDWIVDTLQPWRHRLEILNEVFADPTKLKVFHGASSDIVWLQRDLGLYVVGLFDTYFASERLEYSKRSLAFLLERFANFDADKKYQMADWRIRPLPEEMLYYARSDTHYLLYIYDMVRNELVEKSDRSDPEKDHIGYVLEKSKEVALSRHEALLYDPETGQGPRGWLNGLLRTYTAMSGEQFAVYKALFKWRDDLARKLDESPGFVMPIRTLFDIARILPPDQKALWSLLTNTARATKSSMDELATLIRDARAWGASGPTSIEYLKSDEVLGITKADSTGGAGNRLSRVLAATASVSAAAVAAATAAEARSKELAKLPDVTELRSNFSQLWGQEGRIRSGERRNSDRTPAGDTVNAPWFVQAAITSASSEPPKAAAAVPKMPATEEYIDLSQTPVARKQQADEPRNEAALETAKPAVAPPAEVEEESANEEKDEAFTLKWGKGGKPSKKAKSGEQDKKKKKDEVEKKRAKSASKDVSEQGESGETTTSDSDGGAPINADDEEEFVPFNYDTAGSVLHPKAADKKAAAANMATKKKAFNPYGAKGDDGPKAARRMHFEKTGKTATFKK